MIKPKRGAVLIAHRLRAVSRRLKKTLSYAWKSCILYTGTERLPVYIFFRRIRVNNHADALIFHPRMFVA